MQNQVFEVPASRIRLTGYVLGGVFAMAVGLLVARVMGHIVLAKLLGVGVTIFFAPVTAFYIVEWMRGGIRARIGPAGIEDRVLAVGLIPWSEIEAVDFAVTSAAGSIALTLRNEDEWARKMPIVARLWAEFNRLIRYPRFAVNLAGSGRNRFEALGAALEFKGDEAA